MDFEAEAVSHSATYGPHPQTGPLQAFTGDVQFDVGVFELKPDSPSAEALNKSTVVQWFSKWGLGGVPEGVPGGPQPGVDWASGIPGKCPVGRLYKWACGPVGLWAYRPTGKRNDKRNCY